MLELHFPFQRANGVVVKLSGGADSAILYYAVAQIIADNQLDIPLYTVSMDTDRKPWYSHYANNVIEWVEGQTGVTPRKQFKTFLEGEWGVAEYDRTQHELLLTALKQTGVNTVYTGITQNPHPDDMLMKWDHPQMRFESYEHAKSFVDVGDSTRDDHSDKPVIHRHADWNMITPFVHYDKRMVAKTYRDYGVMNTLFPLTYSCEEADCLLKQPLGMRRGFQEYTHCGQCWFCLERTFGFGRLH
jgi:hypothetical protein